MMSIKFGRYVREKKLYMLRYLLTFNMLQTSQQLLPHSDTNPPRSPKRAALRMRFPRIHVSSLTASSIHRCTHCQATSKSRISSCCPRLSSSSSSCSWCLPVYVHTALPHRYCIISLSPSLSGECRACDRKSWSRLAKSARLYEGRSIGQGALMYI